MTSGQAFTEANRQAFSDLSSTYDSEPWRQKLTAQIALGLQARKDWIGIRWAKPDDMQFGRETKLLDYACGTGSVTKALGPSVTTVRGIDVSEDMVDIFNTTARGSGLKAEQVNAVVGDLLAEEVPERLKGEEWEGFDVVVVGLGFHHFENPGRAVQRLMERLKPGTGVLVIVDFLPFDVNAQGQPEGTRHTIKHSGFTRQGMQTLFEEARLEKFAFSVMDEQVEMVGKDGKTSKRTVFFAKGNREPTTWGKLANWVGGMQATASEQFQIGPRREGNGNKLNLTGGYYATTGRW